MKASQAFPDFISFYERLYFPDPGDIYLPFFLGEIFIFSGFYVAAMIFLLTNNRFPFYILIEPFNRHFWQKIKFACKHLFRRK